MGEEKKLNDILEIIKQVQVQQEKSSSDIHQRLSALELHAGLDLQESTVKSSGLSYHDHGTCKCEGACNCESQSGLFGHSGDSGHASRQGNNDDRNTRDAPRDLDHNYGRRRTPPSRRADEVIYQEDFDPGLAASFAGVTSDVLQSDFKSISDAYAKYKLDSDLRLNDTRTGIKKEQFEASRILGKCGRYVETQFRIFKAVEEAQRPMTYAEFQHLFICNLAQMRYMQEKYAGLVVGGSFGKQTQDIFQSIQSNASVFTPPVVRNIEAAIKLTSTHSEFNNRNRRGGRGGGRGGGNPQDRQYGGNPWRYNNKGGGQARRFPPENQEKDD